MSTAHSKSKAVMSAVVRDKDGNIKRDYGVVARASGNPVLNLIYLRYYRVKRRVIDWYYTHILKA